MKNLKVALAFILSLAVAVTSGCEYLPPLSWFTITPIETTEIPVDLSYAAERILPSTVIVDARISTGTGWIFDESGIIVTNYHVIKDSRRVTVTLHDGRRINVTAMASDPISDLAVLYINASDLTAATISSSSSLRIGDAVVAVGNSNGDGISVKTGRVTRLNMTVSIEGQDFYGLIENNAPIQHGDSGGALVNQAGEVVGISNAKVFGTQDIAYAINIDSALPILHELITTGSVTWPYLGIVGTDNALGAGVVIEEITPGGPADEAGLRVGDIITAIDGNSMRGMSELREYVLSQQVGQRVSVTYRRGGAQAETTVTLGARPSY